MPVVVGATVVVGVAVVGAIVVVAGAVVTGGADEDGAAGAWISTVAVADAFGSTLTTSNVHVPSEGTVMSAS